MIENPVFWGWAVLRVGIDNSKMVMGSGIITSLPNLNITKCSFDGVNTTLGNLFTAIVRGEFTHLKRLDLSNTDLTPQDPGLLSKALVNLEYCRLGSVDWSSRIHKVQI